MYIVLQLREDRMSNTQIAKHILITLIYLAYLDEQRRTHLLPHYTNGTFHQRNFLQDLNLSSICKLQLHKNV